MRIHITNIAIFLLTCILISGCTDGRSNHRRVTAKKQHAIIYEDTKGNHYTRSWNGNEWIYWMIITSQNNSNMNNFNTSTPIFSPSNQWVQTPKPVEALKETNTVVEEINGQPTNEVNSRSEISPSETITEDTTSTQAEEMTVDVDMPAGESIQFDSPTESAQDFSSDAGSFDSGGGDFGGGDGGGGGSE